MATTKKFAVNLPEEMVTEILVRLLPVMSLLRCKSVCKLWLSIISNPNFTQSHLQRANVASLKNPLLLNIQNHSPRLAFPTDIEYVDGEEIDWLLVHEAQEKWRRHLANEALLDIDGQDLSSSPVHFERLVMPRLFDNCEVITSYNGIICLANQSCDVIYLWNPSIRQCKKLPTPTHTSELFSYKIGFGYDSISNDYKVLRLTFVHYYEFIIVQVYSTNADCWREIWPRIPRKPQDCRRSNVVVNGILYVDIGDELVSFDLHNEVFGLVPFPKFDLHNEVFGLVLLFGEVIERKRSFVLDFEGSVAMVFKSGPGIDLWTLEDDCGQLTWTKQFNIDDDPNTGKEIWLSCYLGAGQFYGSKSLGGCLFLYDILYDYEKRETKYIGLGEKYILETLKYTETLVSLEGFEQVE